MKKSIKKNIKKRILVLDDDKDTVIAFKVILEYAGFGIDAFTNPLLVLSVFQPNVYDLLLLDIKMPQLDGITLSQKIKELDKGIKICFLTAGGKDPNEVREDNSSNIQDLFILKPVENEVLLEKIKNILFKNNDDEKNRLIE